MYHEYKQNLQPPLVQQPQCGEQLRIVLIDKYPCPWCKINYEVMHVSCHKLGHAEKQSLENIQEDYDKFVADGSVTSWHKFYHNVIHKKLLDIVFSSK